MRGDHVMAYGHSPTIRRRELGTHLRRLRLKAGLSVDQVAGNLLCSPTKISRMETGHRTAGLRDVRDLCNLYGVEEDERERLMTLAREAKERPWWWEYDLPYSEYVGLEAEAVGINVFESTVVPGLLQTADYARALVETGMPLQPHMSTFSADLVDRRVEARLARQRLLAKDSPPRFHAILDEAVLHRRIGGSAVIREQLAQIVAMARLANVDVQVIPFDAGSHPALDSTFTLLEFAKEDVSDLVYVEGLVGNIYRDRPQDLDRYRQVFGRLRDIALGPRDSADLIMTVAKTHSRSA